MNEPITAQYHGVCTDCEDTIAPGQVIIRDTDNDGWRHDVCGAMADTAPCACEKCFLVHAPSQGACW